MPTPSFLSGPAHGLGLGTVQKQSYQCLNQIGRPIQINIISSLSMNIDFLSGILTACNDRLPVSHRLDVNQSEPLSPARHGKNIGFIPEDWNFFFRNKARKLNVSGAR